MRILIVVRRMTQGGVQQQTASFAQAALALGIETHVLILKSSRHEIPLPEGTVVHRISMRSLQFTSPRGIGNYLLSHLLLPLGVPGSRDFGTGEFLSRWFMKEFLPELTRTWGRPDHIFLRAQGTFDLLHNCHMPGIIHRYVDGAPQKFRARLPLFRPLARWMNRREYGRGDHICVSGGLAEALREITVSCQVPDARITVFRNFVSISRIRSLAQEAPPPGLPEKYIMTLGRLVRPKRQDLIIRALALLPEDVHLVICGGGPMEGELRQLARDLGLEDRVIFTGSTDNPYPLLRQARLLAHASEREGFGLIFLEALILDIPIAAMESQGGMRDVLRGPVLEKQIAPRNPEAFARLIARTMENPYHSTPDMYQQYDHVPAMTELLEKLKA